MPTNHIPLQQVLTAAEYAAIDRFGSAHPGVENLARMAGFLQHHFGLEVATDPEVIAGFAIDGSNLPGDAQGLVRPENERGCAAVLRASYAAKIPLTVSGGRSNLTGSATPRGGLLLATPRLLTPSVQVDSSHAYVTAPVGLLLEDMRRAVQQQTGSARRFPVDPTSRADASVGGCLACNASGFTPGAKGAMRAWVQSLRFLLPNGMGIDAQRDQYISVNGRFILEEAVQARPWPIPIYARPTVKNAGGPFSAPRGAMDIVDLMIGSEGLFGLITACRLLLADTPQAYLDLFIALPDEAAALRLLAAARAHHGRDLAGLTAFEYFGVHCRQFMLHEERFFINNAPVGVYIQEPLFNRDMENAAAAWLTILEAAELEAAAEQILILDTDALRDLFFEARHAMPANALEVVQQRGTFTIMTDTVVPHDRFGEFLEFTHAHIRAQHLDYLSFGHLGDCHLHFTILPRKDQIDQAVAVYDEIIACSADLGGVYSGEHGTGKRKAQDFLRCYGPAGVNSVRDCKQAVDPDGLVNRGNVIPACALA